jgi:phytanoyl-CoA dioxygenase PhyH
VLSRLYWAAMLGALPNRLERFGAVQVCAALDTQELCTLWSSIRPETTPGAVRGRSQQPYGARGILAARPGVARLLMEVGLTRLATSALGAPAFPIDAQFFDKRADANWAVPAHQDVVVPIPAAAPADTVRNPRERHGLRYGEPGVLVLNELVALRVHFDDACGESGGIAIVNGSHVAGRIADADLRKIPESDFEPYDCWAGDVLLMKPLVVHRSARSTLPARRRVLHVLYAPGDGWHARLTPDAA